MTKRLTRTLWISFLSGALLILTSFDRSSDPVRTTTDDLKTEALNILNTKCNTCHRKQNPFMLFNERNMVKRAPKIHYQVFVARRMPKGNKISLTTEEYTTLKNWLNTQNIH